MQISRHWRMKAVRYRLDGVRVNNEKMQKPARAEAQETRPEAPTLKHAATAAR